MFAGFRDRFEGSFWLIPTIFSAAAIGLGALLTLLQPPPGSPWDEIGFQGSAADARTLLITVCSARVTVVALVVGLTVVELQMASTQFSPCLLRNFLRDRTTQVVLGVLIATFAYSAAGLFTVGVGQDPESYPRLAVSAGLVLLIASSIMIVYFADHLAHSLQVDTIMQRVERGVARLIDIEPTLGFEAPTPLVPDRHVRVLSRASGYVQAVHPESFVERVRDSGVHTLMTLGVGEHVVAGTTIAVMWGPRDIERRAAALGQLLLGSIRIGPERTLEQDFGIGFRQLLDSACKALSPAVNDPYTALQAIDHLSVLTRRLAIRPLGFRRVGDDSGGLTIPGRSFGDYLRVVCGLLRRYGSAEPTVMRSLLRLLRGCAEAVSDPARLQDIHNEIDLIAAAAERGMPEPADAQRVVELAVQIQGEMAARRP